MSLRAYSGEYLISPCPVHMGLNYCSHGCWYCFANLNKPDRRGEWSQIHNTLNRFEKNEIGRSLCVWLLRQGHPILCANDSDPFAASNTDAFSELHARIKSLGLQIVYQ